MSTINICPVPKNQRPLKEFRELNQSWFFSWPTNNDITLYINLIKSWAIGLSVCLLINSGSWALKNNMFKLIIISIFVSLLSPLLILIRQWLGWNYIFKRLLSEYIEYEETGWYDGQKWEKPLDWREKDLLIAQYEVKPVLNIIEKTIIITFTAMISGTFICQSI